MEKINIQDSAMPKLGLGTWQNKGTSCVKSVKYALEIGYRHIDTAQIYGNEAEVGEGIKESDVPREDIFLTTKVWRTNLTPEKVIESTQESLDKFQTDYVDLLLVHWPNKKIHIKDTMKAMKKLKSEGKTKLVGVSNFTVQLLRQAQKNSDIAVNQVEYHPFLSVEELLGYMREQGIVLTAYSPLARGQVLKNSTIQQIAKKHNKTPVQVTLRWLMQQDNVTAIPKSQTKEHIEENFDVFDFSLEKDEMQKIYELAQGKKLVDPGFAPDWKW